MRRDVRGEVLFEVAKIQGCAQEDPRFALGPIDFRRDQVLGLGERLRLAETRAAPICEQIAARSIARAPDAIRIREGQQKPCHRVRIGRIERVRRDIPLPKCSASLGLRKGPRINLDAGRQGALVATHDRRAQSHVCIPITGRCAQDVTLAQHRGDVTGESCCAQRDGFPQHVCQARMGTELRQRSAVRRDSACGIDGLQAS